MVKPLRSIADSDLRLFIGGNIELLRTALGKRQMDWVRDYPELLTSAGKLANWEAGRVLADPLFLIRLCEDHGVSMDFFYRGRTSDVSESMSKRLRAQGAASKAG